jgi:hypothetical protein
MSPSYGIDEDARRWPALMLAKQASSRLMGLFQGKGWRQSWKLHP